MLSPYTSWLTELIEWQIQPSLGFCKANNWGLSFSEQHSKPNWKPLCKCNLHISQKYLDTNRTLQKMFRKFWCNLNNTRTTIWCYKTFSGFFKDFVLYCGRLSPLGMPFSKIHQTLTRMGFEALSYLSTIYQTSGI